MTSLRSFTLAATVLMAGLTAAAVSQAQSDPDGWREPIAPSKIAGPIHYVGTRGLAVYLIETPEGHILIDGAVPEAAPAIARSIEASGHKLRDVKILLTTQAHFDHVGSLAAIKEMTGARVLVMNGDDALLASGGTKDYVFASVTKFHYTPVKTDQVLRDGEVIRLGGVALTAHRTPGHTPGTATYTTTIEDGGRKYSVVFPGSTSVNPGTRLVKNPSYPGILEDYRTSLKYLDGLSPDIFLAAHGVAFDFEGKRARAEKDGARAFVDPDGYRRMLANSRAALEKLVAAEQ
ncbi:MAG TPA: subclass B3 metallo-beta-lactamase [Luteitalea sp.]|nr:subclass B3 metallo-beta-lactamase [Luteitalea sp.]